jgi:hypothetical protein
MKDLLASLETFLVSYKEQLWVVNLERLLVVNLERLGVFSRFDSKLSPCDDS